MRLLLLGINHQTAPVALRERLAVNDAELHALHESLREAYPQSECVILSTCNRVELYMARPSGMGPDVDELRGFLAERAGLAVEQVTAASIHREQKQVVQHLFRVCAGLESMVVGEAQILGQVKRDYGRAMEAEAVGPVMHRLFQEAFAAAKRARTQTSIGEGRVSVGSVAVDFTRQVFEGLEDKTVLGLGAGEMAKATLRHMAALRPHRLLLSSRTMQRSRELASALNLAAPHGPRPWEELDELLVAADVIISSTGSRQPILTAERFRPLMKRRRHRPLFIIDIAVPRDVAVEVASLPEVYLYNIDDLNSVVEAGTDQRREQVALAETHLQQAVEACMKQIQHRDLGQLIRQLRQRLHELGELEQQRTRRKLAAADPEAAEAANPILAEHTQRLINKILHLPLSQLDHHDQEAPLGFYAAALRRLFDLEEQAERAKKNNNPRP